MMSLINSRLILASVTACFLFTSLGVQVAKATVCESLAEVLGQAGSGFTNILSARERHGNRVTLMLPNASECYYRDSHASYWCTWAVANKETLQSQYVQFVNT